MSANGQWRIKNVQVAAPGMGLGPCEPSIAISPTNPNNMVVGTVLKGVHYSNDGGKTWVANTLTSKYGVWGDPVLIADDSGAFYFFHLSDPDGRNWKSPIILDRIVVQRSDDSGATWTSGAYTGHNPPKKQDKPWATYSAQTQNLYCTWTEFDAYGSSADTDRSRILFSKAPRGGVAWTTPIILSSIEGDCLDGDSTTEGAVPAAGKNGAVYVAWALNEKIYFNRSFDDGQSWQPEEVAIATQPGGWKTGVPGLPRANGMPVTVVDNSPGPFSGSVYVMWTDTRNGAGNDDVFVALSRNQGESFSAPIRVNTDNTNRPQFLPWLTVDPITGVLYAVFYDRRHHKDNQTDVYLATSTDGGVTWKNKKISKKPFTPETDKLFFGDYNHIAAYNGTVRPVWTRQDGNQTSVWTALIRSKKTTIKK